MKNGSPTPTKCVQKSEVLPLLKKILNTASFHVWQLCHCQVQEKVNANVNNFVLSKTKMSFLYLSFQFSLFGLFDFPCIVSPSKPGINGADLAAE